MSAAPRRPTGPRTRRRRCGRGPGGHGALALACAAWLVACGGEPRSGPPPAERPAPSASPRARLVPVRMPDVSGAEPGLQERVRLRYAALTLARERAAIPDADLAAAFGEVGKLLVAAEFFLDAEPFLLNAQALAPGEMAWPYYLGHVQRLRGLPADAIPFFQRALELAPDDVPALVWLGSLQLDAGNAAAAGPLLERAVRLQPRSAAARFALGRAALAGGDHARAVEHLEAALAADPQALAVYYPLAMAYRARGDAATAEAHLRRWKEGPVLPDDPLMRAIGEALETAVAYEIRGTRALDARRFAEAASLFRKGLEVAPDDATLHQNLGTALYLSGDEAGARAAFERAAALAPAYARPHFSLGVLLDAAGHDADAIARFRAALTFDPQMIDARFALAEALRRTGEAEAALPLYDEVLRADTSASQARFGRAMALVRLGRWAQARAALEDAVAAHPDQPGLPHALARVLAAAPDASVRDGARALSMAQALHAEFGANAALLETMAMALAEAGRFAEAAARQREAMAAADAQGREDLMPAMRDNLQRYESGQPCRTPWRDDDPVHRPRVPGLR